MDSSEFKRLIEQSSISAEELEKDLAELPELPCPWCTLPDDKCECLRYTAEEPFECKWCGALKGQHVAVGLQCQPEHLDWHYDEEEQ